MASTMERIPITSMPHGREHVGWSAGRIAAVVADSILVLASIGLMGAGGFMLSATTSNDGWLDLGHATYATDSYAVTTDPTNWSTQTYLFGEVEKVRIRVTPDDSSTAVFVGMAPADEVQRYLDGVEYVTAHAGRNYQVTYSSFTGQAPATPPGQAIPWTAQATGTGIQTLEFSAHGQPDNEVLVVMNADGSASVSGTAESLVTQPSLSWIGSSLLVGGVIVGSGAALVIIRGARRT